MRKFILLTGLMLWGYFLIAQPYVIRGRVVDALTREALVLVNIRINDTISGGVSDSAGRFELLSPEPVTKLIFSYSGYLTANIVPDLSGKEIQVKLYKLETKPPAVLYTPDNQAAQQIVDSIGKAKKLSKTDKTNEAIIDGRPSLGIFYVDINRFLHYNRYQGLYLGLGLHTNDRLSKLFSLGGYWGYGFGSRSASYGADGILVIDRNSATSMKLELSHDVSESGGLPDFGEVKRLLDPSGFYRLMIRRMDIMDLRQFTFSTGLIKYLRAGVSLFQSVKKPAYDYAYVSSQNAGIAVLDNQFHFSGLSFSLRYAYKETTRQNPRSTISPVSAYPVIRMQITHGIDGWIGGEYAYTRYDVKVEKSFRIKTLGRSSVCLQAGTVSGDVPYCNLFAGRGSYGEFTIYAPQSFATMRQNEFVSDRYASLYFTQDFGKLLPPSRHFNPELAWCAGAGFGDLAHPEKHRDIEVRTLTKGYFESGFLINNLLDLKVYNLGLGAFYRLGTYAFPAFGDNIAFKFSVSFPL